MGSVSVYLSEIATPGHRGFYVSWQNASQQCAVVFAALFAGFYLLTRHPGGATPVTESAAWQRMASPGELSRGHSLAADERRRV